MELLAAALPPTFEVDGATRTCGTAPRLGGNDWALLPGVTVAARCGTTKAVGGGVAGVAITATLKNTTAAAVAVGKCELFRIPITALPAQGLRLLHYPLVEAQAPMQMVEVAGSGDLSCNIFAMLSTPASTAEAAGRAPDLAPEPAIATPAAGAASPAAGGCVAFLTWKRCACVVEVLADEVVASCTAAGFLLPAGGSLDLETAWLSDWAAPPELVWCTWPALAAKAMDARLPAAGRVPVGWYNGPWIDTMEPSISRGATAEDLYVCTAVLP